MNEALLALAELDESIVRARHDVAHPASQALLDEAAAQLDVMGAEKRALDAARAPLLEQAAALEREGTAARDRAGVIAERLDAATGGGRELSAMEEERTALAARASQLEDDELNVLEQLEPLESADVELRAKAQDAASRREAAMGAVSDERDAADAALSALLDQRQALVDALDPALRGRYDLAAKRAGGIGAARLVDGRCGGCRVSVPAAVADRLLHSASGDEIAVCDECGRLLVH